MDFKLQMHVVWYAPLIALIARLIIITMIICVSFVTQIQIIAKCFIIVLQVFIWKTLFAINVPWDATHVLIALIVHNVTQDWCWILQVLLELHFANVQMDFMVLLSQLQVWSVVLSAKIHVILAQEQQSPVLAAKFQTSSTTICVSLTAPLSPEAAMVTQLTEHAWLAP